MADFSLSHIFSLSNITDSNLINFLLVLALFWFILSKMKVKDKITKAHAQEKQAILNSDNEKEKSIFNLKEIKESINTLGAELAKIFNDGKKIIEDLGKTAKNEINEIEQIFENNAKKMLNIENEKIKLETRAELAKKSIDVAKNKLTDALKQDKNLHKKFIDDAISELDEIEIK